MAKEKSTKEKTVAKFNEFLDNVYKKDLAKASNEGKPLVIDFPKLDSFSPELSEMLKEKPDEFFKLAGKSLEQIDLPNPVKIKFRESDMISISDLRAKHIGKFVCIEGIIRRSSEIRPEVVSTDWECMDCNEIMTVPRKVNRVFKPFKCSKCGNRTSFKQVGKKLIDMRWATVEEPFELTGGERPSQVTIVLKDDLVAPPRGRRDSDPGNRLKMTGILREIPRGGKHTSAKLDFFVEVNHFELTEIGWRQLELTKKDIRKIKEMAKDPLIYEKLVNSLAPSLYGMREIKEAVVLQLFGGVPREHRDGTRYRGDIHILLVGDPSSGKSQLIKLVPELIPKGKYVSGKGVTGAGLCMSYDTLVPTAHGEIRKIGDIVEGALKKEKRKTKEGWFSEKGNVEILCLDTRDLKIKKKRATSFFKLKPQGEISSIKTGSGREIKVTKENPLLVIRNGGLEWVEAKDVRKDDHIALARKIPLNHLPVSMEPDFARFAGMIAGDGDVGEREIRFHNTDERYLDYFSDMSESLGFRPRKHYQKTRIPCVRVASKSLCDRLEPMGIPRGVKCDRLRIPDEVMRSDRLLSNFLSGLFDCDGGPVEKGNGSYIEYTTTSRRLAREIQTALLRFGILSKMREREPGKKGFGGKKRRHVIIIRGQDNLVRFSDEIGFTHSKREKLEKMLEKNLRSNTNIDLIPNIREKLGNIRKSMGVKIKNDENLYTLRAYEKGRRTFSRDSLLKFVGELRKHGNHDYFDFLEKLARSDIFWDSVKEIGDAKEEWVYDLTVKGEHNFIANDIIVHNTATVTKDEEFMGGWVLEAGALVLTNGGLLAVDEFEKMNPDDQVAMHEALEQGSISIAKASIVATLPARTAVLAGGNPKLSRFDPYMAISKQITIPDTLLSRFDLKFALRDIPQKKMDTKIVDHVLGSREEGYQPAMPDIETDFIRKYVAYCKQVKEPKMTPDAGKILKKFYINMRKKVEPGGAVPITLRQFEGLMRLAEASARIQLSDVVRNSDAKRAIKLMRFSLKQLGFDAETGEIDIDRAEGAPTTSKDRSKIRTVMEIINELSEKKKEIPTSEIYNMAKKDGIDDVDDVIDKLKREGLLFEPNPNYVQKV